MKTTGKFYSFFFFYLISISAVSQDISTKYGKIDENTLKMKIYDKDSTANAVILYDYGKCYFQINDNSDGFQIVFERHTKIKILNKNGYSWANVEIPLYKGDNNEKEKIGSIKATTFNLEGSEIIKSKMDNDAVFTEEINDHWVNKKFTLPNVKEGSVIEYRYSIVSDFTFNFRSWQFQYDIPVVYSEYEGLIPEYYTYKQTLKGYLPLSIREKSIKEETFNIKYETLPDVGGVVQRGIYSINSKSILYHLIAKDIPAFIEEPYMGNSENYLMSVDFELASTKFPWDGLVKEHTTTWEMINKKLLEDKNFGKQISSQSNFLSNATSSINEEYSLAEDKMKAAFEYVKKVIVWNNRYNYYTSDKLEKVYLKKSGSIADINLMLLMLLKKLNIDAYPIVLSSRNNGIIHLAQPNVSRFNYVIAAATISGKTYFLDASEPLCPVGILPIRCLNGFGRIVGDTISGWISLDTNATYTETIIADLKFNDNNALVGSIQCSKKDYAALIFRTDLKKESSEENYIKEIQKGESDIEITGYKFENVDSIYNPVILHYDILLPIKKDEMIYFTPMIFDRLKENIFKQEKRTYPIDFIFKTNLTYIMNFTLPEGYTLVENPENSIVIMPDYSSKYTYIVNTVGDIVQVIYKLSINKTLFTTEDYELLKEFFGSIVAKQSEQIVLKKI